MKTNKLRKAEIHRKNAKSGQPVLFFEKKTYIHFSHEAFRLEKRETFAFLRHAQVSAISVVLFDCFVPFVYVIYDDSDPDLN